MKKTVKHKLIVLEGGDGAGKATQASLLIKTLKRLGHTVTYFDFPRYDQSFFGHLTGRALRGDFGDFRHMSPYISSLPYMLDRFTALPEIEIALNKGIVICNRYTSSSMAFQATKLTGKPKKDIIQFVERAEYDELGLPRPNLVIYLHVPPTFSFEMIARKASRNYLGKKNGTRDQHEKDRDFQEATVRTYLQLVRTKPDWKKIDCCERGGKLLSPEAIHEMVMVVVKECVL